MIVRRALLVTLAALAAVSVHSPARAQLQAQDWPQRPVKIVVPYAPGGNADGMARMIGQRLGEVLGQQLVVENRTGAGGTIAVESVVRAPADGYTLLWGVQPQIVIIPAMQKVGYDPVKDIAPISVLATNPFVLTVNGRLPATTVAELVAWVRAQPGKPSYGSSGVGSVAQLAMALFLKRAGLEMTPVHYRGNAPALADVVAGHVPAMFSSLADALPHAASGSVRLLAVSGARRAAQVPDVPTVSEAGYRGYSVVTWNGLMAPAQTPKPIIDKVAAEVARAVKDAAFAERLTRFGVDPLGNSPAEFADLIQAELKLWAEAVEIAGVRQQAQ
jgi:tripartite-type tricarboxylate transporter receptor subunit TctC